MDGRNNIVKYIEKEDTLSLYIKSSYPGFNADGIDYKFVKRKRKKEDEV